MTLDGRVTLVTGGAIRVGRAIVQALAADGATVAVHHHASVEEARSLVTELRSQGRRAEAFRADLTDDVQLASLVADVERSLGPIEVLVNSAAGFTRAPFLDTDAATLDAEWRLNARAPFLLTRAVAKGMLERREGVVVNILDIGGALVPWRNYSAYCMTKAAMQMLTQVLALELAPHVRVNGVAPGTVLPPESLGAAEREQLRSRIPLGRFGTAEDVAATVRFLITGSDFVTGQVIAVDGGRTRGSP
ncbi:MAG TPA: SDR family oxidoreductase [Myxococcaceae bacterium]|nr:SDR family oxidoreductase [Myxococcaceae bacterium]